MNNSVSKALAVSKNIFYRIISAFLSTGVRQFLVLPVLAKLFSDEVYGTILTVNSVSNITEVSLGNTLNNTRIISDQEYEQKGFIGDFKIYLFIAQIIGAICCIFSSIYFKLSLTICILLIISSFFAIHNAYYVVYYVMTLQFNKWMIQSIIVAIGTVIGAGLTWITNLWPLAFLIGNMCSSIYMYFNNPYIKEPYVKTPLILITSKKWSTLAATSLLGNALVYLDRLLIYPMLGGDSVAAYTTASFYGKLIAALMPPVANVLLGYFSQKSFAMNKKRFFKIICASSLFCTLGFISSLVLSPLVTKWFYPTLYESAKGLLILANAAALLGALGTLIQTIVLKYCKTKYLLYIQIVYGFLYLGGGIIILTPLGLTGFCYISIVSNLVKVVLMIIIGLNEIKRLKEI